MLLDENLPNYSTRGRYLKMMVIFFPTLARFSFTSAQYLWNLTMFKCSSWIKLSNTALTFSCRKQTNKQNIQLGKNTLCKN